MAVRSQTGRGRQHRRSERVPHCVRLLISGADRGIPFVADGETVTVNQYGACVRTNYPLQPGMRVRLKSDQARVARHGRVVCISVNSASEFGVEMEASASDFWGISIPTLPRPQRTDTGDSARAMDVIVSGISAICMPFQEHTMLLPLTATSAVTRVRPLVKPGERLRLLVGPSATPMRATVTSVSKDRVSGRWRLWIEYSA